MPKPFPKKSFLLFFHLLFAFQIAWNVYLYTLPRHNLSVNYLFNILYALTPLAIGVIVLVYVFRHRREGQVIFALCYLGLGAISFGLGLYSWSYYNLIVHVEVPHPSLGEVFLLAHPFFITYGTIKLLRFYTSLIRWRVVLEASAIFFLFAVPTYQFFLVPTLSPDLTFFTRFIILGLVIGNALLMSLVYVMVRVGGGVLRSYWLLYGIAYLLVVAAEFIFQYSINQNTYWNGSLADTLLTIHFYLFALAVIGTLNTFFSKLSIAPNPVESTPVIGQS